jgi:hypothetical protein
MVADGDRGFRTFLRHRAGDFSGRRLPVAKQVFYDTVSGAVQVHSIDI